MIKDFFAQLWCRTGGPAAGGPAASGMSDSLSYGERCDTALEGEIDGTGLMEEQQGGEDIGREHMDRSTFHRNQIALKDKSASKSMIFTGVSLFLAFFIICGFFYSLGSRRGLAPSEKAAHEPGMIDVPDAAGRISFHRDNKEFPVGEHPQPQGEQIEDLGGHKTNKKGRPKYEGSSLEGKKSSEIEDRVRLSIAQQEEHNEAAFVDGSSNNVLPPSGFRGVEDDESYLSVEDIPDIIPDSEDIIRGILGIPQASDDGEANIPADKLEDFQRLMDPSNHQKLFLLDSKEKNKEALDTKEETNAHVPRDLATITDGDWAKYEICGTNPNPTLTFSYTGNGVPGTFRFFRGDHYGYHLIECDSPVPSCLAGQTCTATVDVRCAGKLGWYQGAYFDSTTFVRTNTFALMCYGKYGPAEFVEQFKGQWGYYDTAVENDHLLVHYYTPDGAAKPLTFLRANPQGYHIHELTHSTGHACSYKICYKWIDHRDIGSLGWYKMRLSSIFTLEFLIAHGAGRNTGALQVYKGGVLQSPWNLNLDINKAETMEIVYSGSRGTIYFDKVDETTWENTETVYWENTCAKRICVKSFYPINFVKEMGIHWVATHNTPSDAIFNRFYISSSSSVNSQIYYELGQVGVDEYHPNGPWTLLTNIPHCVESNHDVSDFPGEVKYTATEIENPGEEPQILACEERKYGDSSKMGAGRPPLPIECSNRPDVTDTCFPRLCGGTKDTIHGGKPNYCYDGELYTIYRCDGVNDATGGIHEMNGCYRDFCLEPETLENGCP